MPARVRRHVSFSMTAWLLIVWLTVFGSLDWIVVLGGVLVAIGVQVVFPLPIMPALWQLRPLSFIVLAVRFLYDLLVAGVQVSWLVVSRHPHEDGIVKCPVRSDNPVYMTMVAAMTSMVPGTIVIEASRDEKELYLHVLDMKTHGGIAGVRREVYAQEKRVLLAVAPWKVLVETGLARSRRNGGDADSRVEKSVRYPEVADETPEGRSSV